MTFDPAGRSVDEILDYGAAGLEYWERFLPLYERAFGALPGVGTRELQARYDEQRGLDLERLDAARNALADAVIGAERQWMAQLGVARRLPDIWAGRGGAAAREVVDGQQRRARGDLDIARAVVAAIDGVLDPLRQAVFTKAVRTVGLLERRGGDSTAVAIGGKSPGDIEAMLDAADEAATDWLRTTFKPDVERKHAEFTAMCADTDHIVVDNYRTVTTPMAALLDSPYPRPVAPFEPPLPANETGTAPTQPADAVAPEAEEGTTPATAGSSASPPGTPPTGAAPPGASSSSSTDASSGGWSSPSTGASAGAPPSSPSTAPPGAPSSTPNVPSPGALSSPATVTASGAQPNPATAPVPGGQPHPATAAAPGASPTSATATPAGAAPSAWAGTPTEPPSASVGAGRTAPTLGQPGLGGHAQPLGADTTDHPPSGTWSDILPGEGTGAHPDPLPLGSLLTGAGSALTELLGHLTTGLQTGVESALGSLSDLTNPDRSDDPATEPGTDEGTDQGDRDSTPGTDQPAGRADFELGEHDLTIEQTTNGTLSVALTDPSGATTTFTLRLNEHGIPILTAESETPAAPPKPDTPQPDSPRSDPTAPDGSPQPSPYAPSAPNPGETSNAPSSPPDNSTPPDCPPPAPECTEPPTPASESPPVCRTPDRDAPDQGAPDVGARGRYAPDEGAPGQNVPHQDNPEHIPPQQDSPMPPGPPDAPSPDLPIPDLPGTDSPPTYPGIPPLDRQSSPDIGATGVPVQPIPPLPDPPTP
ncbi:isoprenoid biosynthesis enzyme family protein [Nocardia otitidiscaviarum]|uniref:hypothetical protein n=1 Tax=Nocardia otitidiscaviarum TaxID=1823 RepID=UPI001893FFEE|nr:hypothetical protein [Nocardia otitidiscaviarum]MBF6179694.1 hypothetical protein [Nocardia otitidiscaviarum]